MLRPVARRDFDCLGLSGYVLYVDVICKSIAPTCTLPVVQQTRRTVFAIARVGWSGVSLGCALNRDRSNL